MTCAYDPRPLLGQPIGMFHCPECGEMVLAGLPHPTMTEAEADASYAEYMRQQDALIDRMCEAAWNLRATRKWADIPEEWKPFYRQGMVVANQVMLRGSVDNDTKF
jgi:hypothetical protein